MERPVKTLSPISTIAVAYNICQSWVAIGATFALSIGHGGHITVIYGMIFIAILYSLVALSIAGRYSQSIYCYQFDNLLLQLQNVFANACWLFRPSPSIFVTLSINADFDVCYQSSQHSTLLLVASIIGQLFSRLQEYGERW